MQCVTEGAYSSSDFYGGADFFCNAGHALKRVEGSNPSCVRCPKGRFSSAAYPTPTCGDCTSCPAGRYGTLEAAHNLSSGCTSCPAGYHQSKVNATRCHPCRAGIYGQFDNEISENCTARCPSYIEAACTAGTSSPKAPIIGFYLANVTTKEQKQCPTGKFKSTLDFEECGICPIGKYTAMNASTYCADCAAGLHAATNTSDGCSPCDESTGHYQDQFGQGGCTTEFVLFFYRHG